MTAVDFEVPAKIKDELKTLDITPSSVTVISQNPILDSFSNTVKSVMAENHNQSPTSSSEKSADSTTVGCLMNGECNSDGVIVSNPPKSSPILSPEVISDSNSTSASESTVPVSSMHGMVIGIKHS